MPSGFKRFVHFSFINQFSKKWHRLTSTASDRKGAKIQYDEYHGLRTPREKIAFTAWPKIQSLSQIFMYGRSIFCLPNRPNFSDIFDLCLHCVSVVREIVYTHQKGFHTFVSLVSYFLVWPQWWSFADVSQQGVDFSKKISKIRIIFWFDFHRCSQGSSKSA